MKALSVTYKRTFNHRGGSGTGCSIPEYYVFELDNGQRKEITIDTWYLTEDRVRGAFVRDVIDQLGWLENMDEAYVMFAQQLVQHTCCDFNKLLKY